ncbi:MBL fold metallo-hydrolase [Candidatus Micrarchaeota archaeon]|nr:MBL fold metallo-hydrolase [Candidatus Micrarchaeota archaeon]MBU1931000.1 MBL fold metallo-hydrolase [Candidatus Micrarchaeota archaeon]
MSEVTVLIEGYAREKNGTEVASSTSVLIKDSGLKILVDPGSNKKLLVKALERKGLQPNDIDIVFLSHYHLDHILNIRLFPDKDILDGNTISRNDQIIDFEGKIPNTTIEVIPTPGHASEHCSLAIKTEKGTVVVAGDVFWWADNETQKTDSKSLLEHKDPYEKDHAQLLASRKKLLKIADFIISGHGKMFKVEK